MTEEANVNPEGVVAGAVTEPASAEAEAPKCEGETCPVEAPAEEKAVEAPVEAEKPAEAPAAPAEENKAEAV